MFDFIEYTEEAGNDIGHQVTVYALSTCGFCKKGIQFLRDNKVKFRFNYLDKLDYAVKKDVKTKLKEQFDKRVVFPFLVVDEKEALLGFVKDDWAKVLGI